MSLHVFANFVTPFGTAANNRGENEGNITTLQKLLWLGETRSTVSAEAIRFALRRRLAAEEQTNRTWNEDNRVNEWKDHQFKSWANGKGSTYIDDDLLGYMTAEAAKEEGESGSANVRRSVLEVSRAISLTSWAGDVTFNAASPGATPSAQKKGSNPVPYGTEVHATRFQFGIALTPERLRDKSRAGKAITALCNLRQVAGNHGRFLFDFSPHAVAFRLTDDPAPRLLYCFETTDDGLTVDAPTLLRRVTAGDVLKDELILGVDDLECCMARSFEKAGIKTMGVKAAVADVSHRMNKKLGTER